MKYIALLLFLYFVSNTALNKTDLLRVNPVTTDLYANSMDKVLPLQWYEGKAEVSTFDLKQNRYNNLHDGEIVMIFVTEDFLTDKQVKNDNYTSNKSTPILKHNQVRKFTTGVYDYSIYSSTFTKVKNSEHVETLKVTMSSQDWCGQSYSQINKTSNQYKINSFSYFENEGDKSYKIENSLLLDEVFNLIRIGDKYLPVGQIEVTPSLIFSRLKHKPCKSYKGKATLEDYKDNLIDEGPLSNYTIVIPEFDFTFQVVFVNKGNREIIAFKEAYPSAFDGVIRETVATRKSIQWLDYWTKNNKEDYSLRSELQIDYQ